MMDFGDAIRALKRGKKVTRRGWNGRGMFLYLKPATMVKAEWCHDPELKALCEANGGELLALGTICMYTHDSTGRNAILTGWLASQSDMLLEDWEIYKESNTDKSPSDTCGTCERSSLICDNDGHDLAYCHEDKKFRAPCSSACKWYKPLTIPEEEQ